MRNLLREIIRHNSDAKVPDTHWSTDAPCAGQWRLTHAEQRDLCATCPVWSQCLDDGLANPDLAYASRVSGEMPLWAGLTTRELYQIKTRRSAA